VELRAAVSKKENEAADSLTLLLLLAHTIILGILAFFRAL
jgi:hypothetical protein